MERLFVFGLRINEEFFSTWNEFKRLASKDSSLLEMHYIKLEKNARFLSVAIRNLIAKYVKEKKKAIELKNE